MHPVAGLNDEIALGDDGAHPLPLHGAEEHLGQLAGFFLIDFSQRQAHHGVPLGGAEIHHFHPAPGEGFHLAREGKAQHAADLPGGGNAQGLIT